jgi:hypothetical protein
MGFEIRRIDKINNDSVVDRIHEDYHNGDCVILNPLSELETIGDDLKYLVVDFNDYLVLIYPKKT